MPSFIDDMKKSLSLNSAFVAQNPSLFVSSPAKIVVGQPPVPSSVSLAASNDNLFKAMRDFAPIQTNKTAADPKPKLPEEILVDKTRSSPPAPPTSFIAVPPGANSNYSGGGIFPPGGNTNPPPSTDDNKMTYIYFGIGAAAFITLIFILKK